MNFFIVGAGGLGRVVGEIISQKNEYRFLGYIDDKSAPDKLITGNGRVLGGTEFALERLPKESHFVVAIGDNKTRKELFVRFSTRFSGGSVIHPSASVSQSAQISPGCIVLAQSVIGSNAILGSNCILDSLSLVDHDCQIGPHSYIAPGTLIGSRSELPELYTTSIGSKILSGTKV